MGDTGDFDDLHPSARRVAVMLAELGVRGPFREFAASTKTARDAASALGCDVGAIASCLVFVVDDRTVVVVKSGAFRVDTAQLGELLGGERVRTATPDEVRLATGQAIGGVSPVGWPASLEVLIDESLARFEQLWAACGTPNAVFATNFEQLQSLTNARKVAFRNPG